MNWFRWKMKCHRCFTDHNPNHYLWLMPSVPCFWTFCGGTGRFRRFIEKHTFYFFCRRNHMRPTDTHLKPTHVSDPKSTSTWSKTSWLKVGVWALPGWSWDIEGNFNHLAYIFFITVAANTCFTIYFLGSEFEERDKLWAKPIHHGEQIAVPQKLQKNQNTI